MTLSEIVKLLNTVALEQPSVGEYIPSGNIYDLSEERNAKFGVFCATQGQHVLNPGENTITYVFNLFYVDRLQSDGDNKIEIQSTGISTLSNIIRTIQEDYDEWVFDSVYFDVFTERFSEMCAGVYATVRITLDDELNCAELF